MMNMLLVPVDPLSDMHVGLLYDLLLERPHEANISHQTMPTYEQHKDFVASVPYMRWYIIRTGDVFVGSVYLTHQREIGVFIKKSHHRLGFARRAVQILMLMHPQKKFLANVAPDNAASHALFQKLGGKIIQQTYALPC